ncbi:hypothetical protein D6D01_09733, partial [Aureobasidium pullulans]
SPWPKSGLITPKTLASSRGGTDAVEPVDNLGQPTRILLRIYGPQVEHLIDLMVDWKSTSARRHLALKTCIAKRMRELHKGVDLLERERDKGAFVWQNWDKWFYRTKEVTLWLDGEVLKRLSISEICLWTRWAFFNETVQRYYEWLEAQYTEPGQLRSRYIFAHNDTRHGNILRLIPSGISPLLLIQNTHRQLIVIDFEYANADTPSIELANHFTEWSETRRSTQLPKNKIVLFAPVYAIHPNSIPLILIRDLWMRIAVATIENLLVLRRSLRTSCLILKDLQAAFLLRETRMWRIANPTQWVTWVIIQAKVPGFPSNTFASSLLIENPEENALTENEDRNVMRSQEEGSGMKV